MSTRTSEWLGWTLSEENARAFRNHKYQKAGVTVLEPTLDPVFGWIASLVPKAITPNQITVLGALVGMATISFCVYMDPSFDPDTRPWWLPLVAVSGTTTAMLLDAIDGKHARNTKQSSAVGSWLDHGFDAMTLVYQTVYALYALNVPTWNLWAVIATVMSQCAWTSVWVEKKMTGVMRFPLMADVEGNMFVMAINVVNAYMPFWRSFMRSTAFVLPVMGGLEIPGYGAVVMGVLLINLVLVGESFLNVLSHYNKSGRPQHYLLVWADAWGPVVFNIALHTALLLWRGEELQGPGWVFVWVLSEGGLFCLLVSRFLMQDLCHVPKDRQSIWMAPLFFIVVNEFYLKFTPYGLAVDLYTLVFWHMVYACGGFLWHMAMVYFQILYQYSIENLRKLDQARLGSSERRGSVGGSRRATARASSKKKSTKKKSSTKKRSTRKSSSRK